MIMDKVKLNKIGDVVERSEFFQKYGYKGHWTSGSSTLVYPITVNMVDMSIVIQLGCNTLRGVKKALDKLVREIGEALVSKHYICKYDGSCPNAAKIYFN
jgi:hypothetical protein